MAIQNFSFASPAAYPVSPNVVLAFQPKKVTFFLDDSGAGKSLTISLDGVTDHIHLHADHSILQYVCEQRHTQFWVKGTSSAGLLAIAES